MSPKVLGDPGRLAHRKESRPWKPQWMGPIMGPRGFIPVPPKQAFFFLLSGKLQSCFVLLGKLDTCVFLGQEPITNQTQPSNIRHP